MRFERTTYRLGGGRSILLSYADEHNEYIIIIILKRQETTTYYAVFHRSADQAKKTPFTNISIPMPIRIRPPTIWALSASFMPNLFPIAIPA